MHPITKNFRQLELFLTDSQKSRIHLVYWQNFSISLAFFAWNVLKHRVKPKNIKKCNIFFKKSPIHLVYTQKLFLHCFRVYFASWKCFYPSPTSLSRFPASLRARRKKLRQEKKVRGRKKKFQAGEKGFFPAC